MDLVRRPGLHAQAFDHVVGASLQRAFLAHGVRQPEQRREKAVPDPRIQAAQHGLAAGGLEVDARRLEGARDAGAHHLVRRMAGDVAAVELDRVRRRLQEAGEAVEGERALARAACAPGSRPVTRPGRTSMLAPSSATTPPNAMRTSSPRSSELVHGARLQRGRTGALRFGLFARVVDGRWRVGHPFPETSDGSAAEQAFAGRGARMTINAPP